MYVCICNGITDKQIKTEVAAGAQTLDDLQQRLGVATCCGACGPLACSYLPNPEPIAATVPAQDYRDQQA